MLSLVVIMQQRLIFNHATGTWMPAPELVPQMRYSVPMQPAVIGTPTFTPIPVGPAPPIQARIPQVSVSPHVYASAENGIPLRPRMDQPRIPEMPKDIRDKGKWGQVAVVETLPKPDTIPAPNLPNMHAYNAQRINAYQASIEQKILNRESYGPDAQRPALQHVSVTRLKPADLGLNATHGSNSAMLRFGRSLGRTVGQESFSY